MTTAELEKKLENCRFHEFFCESSRLLIALFSTFLAYGFTEAQLKAFCAELIDNFAPKVSK